MWCPAALDGFEFLGGDRGDMELENKLCRVAITVDNTYTIGSADNRYYNVVLNPGGYSRRDWTATLCIDVDLVVEQLRIALIGSQFTYDSQCAVLEGEVLTVLQDKTVTQLRVTDGALLRSVDIGGPGHNYAIYQVDQAYLICGELEIAMLNFDLQKLWTFSGADIFASVTGKNPVELRERSIVLYDFEDNRYELDYDGNVIS